MKAWAIRESWNYEIYDLVEFFLDRDDAQAAADEKNLTKSDIYNDYKIEEIDIKEKQ